MGMGSRGVGRGRLLLPRSLRMHIGEGPGQGSDPVRPEEKGWMDLKSQAIEPRCGAPGSDPVTPGSQTNPSQEAFPILSA